MTVVVGSVATVLRYPVKSMLGEAVDAAHIGEGGVQGDRAFAALDRVTGRVASAKNPRLWQPLLRLSARAIDSSPTPAVRVVLPDGAAIESTDPDVDDVLSQALGRRVTLASARAPGAAIDRADPVAAIERDADAELPMAELTLAAETPGASFVDYAPLHLITTATLDRIGALSPHGRADAARYRPNLVVDTAATGPGFVENGWIDGALEIGDTVVVRVIVPTPRCAVPSLAQGDLPRDPEAVRVPFRHNRLRVLDEPATGCAGVYARVLEGGTVRTGDPVRLRSTSG